jgi:hypothetical protein
MDALPESPLPDVRDLTQEEYDATYASGSGGHKLPDEILAVLNTETDHE